MLSVSLCFLSCSVLTPWVYGVNFSDRIPVRFSGAVSLISWACWFWAIIYVGSLYFFGFWLLLGLSLVGPSLQLVNWGSLCPPCLVLCCAGMDRLCWSWFFGLYEVLRLLSHSCSVVFPDRSWVELVWLTLPPSPSSAVICWLCLCWWVSSSSRYSGIHSFYLLFFFLFVIGWRGKVKWFKTEGVYSMIFKVPALGKKVEDPLDMYSVNHDILSN